MAHMSPQVCRRHFERPLPQSTAMLKSHDSKTISGFKPPYLRDCTPLPRTVTTSQNHLQPIGPPCRHRLFVVMKLCPYNQSARIHIARGGAAVSENQLHINISADKSHSVDPVFMVRGLFPNHPSQAIRKHSRREMASQFCSVPADHTGIGTASALRHDLHTFILD